MKTVLDVTVCTHSRGGVGRWVRGLSRGLMEASAEHISIDLHETHPGLPCTVIEAAVIPSPDWMVIPFLRRLLLKRGRLEATRAKRITAEVGVPDIIHLSGVQPFGTGRRKVVTFFDDTPWTDPSSHTEETLFYASRLRKLVDDGASVLSISRWAAERAVEIFGISPDRVGYAGGAAEDIFTPGEPDRLVMEEYGLVPGEYFLHVGSFVPRKNIPFLVKCFRRAGKGAGKLVLAGAEKWGGELPIQEEGILAVESISDRLLLSLYRGARALLVPSISEGLGLPVLEALACGTPVFASDGGALPETLSGRGLILPVNDPEAWTDAITRGADERLRKLAAGAPRSSWSEVGLRAMDFYRSQL